MRVRPRKRRTACRSQGLSVLSSTVVAATLQMPLPRAAMESEGHRHPPCSHLPVSGLAIGQAMYPRLTTPGALSSPV
jgi:hypothetical protein